MKIKDLTKGYKFYTATINGFEWYTYFAPMDIKPANEGDPPPYHIIINGLTKEPERVYIDKLWGMLNMELRTIDDVRNLQIKLTKQHLKYLENETVN